MGKRKNTGFIDQSKINRILSLVEELNAEEVQVISNHLFSLVKKLNQLKGKNEDIMRL